MMIFKYWDKMFNEGIFLIRFMFIVVLASYNSFHGMSYAQSKMDRPNIVLYLADDLGTMDIGPYGNKHVKTPNLDKLSQKSILFNQAFSTATTCAPSRSALFTGLYPQRNGSHSNRVAVRDTVKSIVQYFVNEGYRVAIAGKLDVGPRQVFPFEYIPGTNRREPGTEGKKGMFPDLYLEPVDKWFADRDPSLPFLLIVSDHSTHMSWPLHPEYTAENVNIPPFHVDTKDTRQLRARYYTDITKLDYNVGETMKMLERHQLEDNTIVLFTADQGPQLPFGKWTLYDYGVQVPLIVSWPGHVKKKSKTDALVSHVDIIPTLLEMVGGKVPEGIDGQSFYSAVKDPNQSHRESVFANHNGDKFYDQSPSRMLRTSSYKYIVNLEPEMPASAGKKPYPSWIKKAEMDAKAKVVVDRLNQRPAEELYDLKADRYEMKNLAGLPKYKKLIEGFRKQMEVVRNAQGDIGDNWKKDLENLPADNKPNPLIPYQF